MRFSLAIVVILSVFIVTEVRAFDWTPYGGVGDVAFRDVCPEHQMIVGFERRQGSLTDQITALCATLYSDGSLAEPKTTLQPHGGMGGTKDTVTCRTQGVKEIKVFFTDDKRRIATLSMRCVSPDQLELFGVDWCLANGHRETCGQLRPLPDLNISSDPPRRQFCGGDEWAVGIHGRSGKHLNAIGLICEPVEPVFKAVVGKTRPGNVKDHLSDQVVEMRKLKKRGSITDDAVGDLKPSASATASAPAPQQPTPPAAPHDNFAGEWATVTAAGNRYTMRLTQTGRKVTGTYAHSNGAPAGTLSGRVKRETLTYSWREGNNSGSGRFTLGQDGNSFSGWWNSTVEPNDVGDSWTGTRLQ